MKTTIIAKQTQLQDGKEELGSGDDTYKSSGTKGAVTKGSGVHLQANLKPELSNGKNENAEDGHQTLSISNVHNAPSFQDLRKEKSLDLPQGIEIKHGNIKKKASQLELDPRQSTWTLKRTQESMEKSGEDEGSTKKSGDIKKTEETHSKNQKNNLYQKPSFRAVQNNSQELHHTENQLNNEQLSSPANKISPFGNRMPSPSKRGAFGFSSKNSKNFGLEELEMFSKPNMDKLEEKLNKKENTTRVNPSARRQEKSNTASEVNRRITKNKAEAKVQLRELFKLKKQLLKEYSKEISGPKLHKIVDHKGNIIQKMSKDEVKKQFTDKSEQEELSELSSDETIVYEQVADTDILIKKKIKRIILDEVPTDELLADIDRQIFEASHRVLAELDDITMFKKANIFERLIGEEEVPKKVDLKFKSVSSHYNLSLFSRTNNNLPNAFKNIKEINEKVQFFILIWLRDNLEVDARTIEILLRDASSRHMFFRDNKDLFEIVLDTVLKKPHLYAKVKEFLFGKKASEKSEVLGFNKTNFAGTKSDQKSEKTASTQEVQSLAKKSSKNPTSRDNTYRFVNAPEHQSSVPKLDFAKLISPLSVDQHHLRNSATSRSFHIKRRQQKEFYSKLRDTANRFTITAR